MDGGSRKGQMRWNVILGIDLRRDLMRVAANYRVRGGEAWRCLYPEGIPAYSWYSMPLWVNLDTEPPIMPSILDLVQPREGWRCHDGLSMPMYEKI